MTNRLLVRFETKQVSTGNGPVRGGPRLLVLGILGLMGLAGLGLLAVLLNDRHQRLLRGQRRLLGRPDRNSRAAPAGAKARSIPADYLSWYQKVGQQYGVPWTILAGIGTVESDKGQTTLRSPERFRSRLREGNGLCLRPAPPLAEVVRPDDRYRPVRR
jgi:hypothetical protein